jgi:hypothetical protein
MNRLRAVGTLSLDGPAIHFIDTQSPTDSDLFRGVVTLSLRQPVSLSSLVVRLHGQADLVFNDSTLSTAVLCAALTGCRHRRTP